VGESTKNNPRTTRCLSAEILLGFLVQQDHPAPRIGEFGGGDETGQTGSNDDDVCVHARRCAGNAAGGSRTRKPDAEAGRGSRMS
jgi:hypothetical protein